MVRNNWSCLPAVAAKRQEILTLPVTNSPVDMYVDASRESLNQYIESVILRPSSAGDGPRS